MWKPMKLGETSCVSVILTSPVTFRNKPITQTTVRCCIDDIGITPSYLYPLLQTFYDVATRDSWSRRSNLDLSVSRFLVHWKAGFEEPVYLWLGFRILSLLRNYMDHYSMFRTFRYSRFLRYSSDSGFAYPTLCPWYNIDQVGFRFSYIFTILNRRPTSRTEFHSHRVFFSSLETTCLS